MKHLQKSLSLFLCIVLCLSLFPVAGFAEGSEAVCDEITEGEPASAEGPEEAAEPTEEVADTDVIEEEEAAADAEPEQVIPEDVPAEDDAVIEEAEEPEEDAERMTGSTEQVEGFVRRGYSLMLGRDADADGLQYYVNLLTSGRLSGAQMVSNFMNSPEFTDKRVSNEEAVTILYRVMMNREPDADGLAYHKANLDRGLSYNCVINNFSGSPEFGGICAESGITPGAVGLEWRDQNPLVTDFVNRNYLYALERKGEGDGLNYYCEILLNRSLTPQQVAHDFVFSDECTGHNLNNPSFVTMLYHLYMDREPDESGYRAHLNALNTGMSRQQVVEGFANSPEFKNIVASYGLATEENPNIAKFEELGCDKRTVNISDHNGQKYTFITGQLYNLNKAVELTVSCKWIIAYEKGAKPSQSTPNYYIPNGIIADTVSLKYPEKIQTTLTNVNGYEWRCAKVNFECASDLSWYVVNTYEDFYTLVQYDEGNSIRHNSDNSVFEGPFSVEYNGAKYDKCYIYCEVNMGNSNENYIYTFFRVPCGYDGCVLGCVDGRNQTQPTTGYFTSFNRGPGDIYFRLK